MLLRCYARQHFFIIKCYVCIIVSKEVTSMQSKKFNDKSNVIGQTVRKYRMQKGYTQEQLCQQLDLLGLNLYLSDIHLIENNKRIVKITRLLPLQKYLVLH